MNPVSVHPLLTKAKAQTKESFVEYTTQFLAEI